MPYTIEYINKPAVAQLSAMSADPLYDFTKASQVIAFCQEHGFHELQNVITEGEFSKMRDNLSGYRAQFNMDELWNRKEALAYAVEVTRVHREIVEDLQRAMIEDRHQLNKKIARGNL